MRGIRGTTGHLAVGSVLHVVALFATKNNLFLKSNSVPLSAQPLLIMAKSEPKSSRKKDKPHDAVFKTFFGDVGIVRNYLAHYTGPEVYGHIDLAALRKCDTAFVGGRFGVSFSDVVYETRLNSGAPVRLLFLFEHKSYQPEHPVQLQLLDYMLQLWEDDLANTCATCFWHSKWRAMPKWREKTGKKSLLLGPVWKTKCVHRCSFKR